MRNRAGKTRRPIELSEEYLTPETATRRQRRDAQKRALRLEKVGIGCHSESDVQGIGLALEFDRFE